MRRALLQGGEGVLVTAPDSESESEDARERRCGLFPRRGVARSRHRIILKHRSAHRAPLGFLPPSHFSLDPSSMSIHHSSSYRRGPTPAGPGYGQGGYAQDGYGQQQQQAGYGAPPQSPYGHSHSHSHSYGPPPGADPTLWQWFSNVDTDRSGAISASELQNALRNGEHRSQLSCG